MSPYSINPKPEPLGSWTAHTIATKHNTSVNIDKNSKLSLLGNSLSSSSETCVGPSLDIKTELDSPQKVSSSKKLDFAIYSDKPEKELQSPWKPPSGSFPVTPKDFKGKPSACVFVASLLSSKSDVQLCRTITDHFEQFGKIVNVKVLRDYSGRPYAFVQYSNDNDCKQAIKESHNTILDGRMIRCEAAKVNRTLFITCFEATTKESIVESLEVFGETELVVASDQLGKAKKEGSDTPCRFWFVKFSYRDDAIRAFASLADDSLFHVEWAKNIEDQATMGRFDKYTIFIGLLSRFATNEDIEAHFGRHGEIKSASVLHKFPASYGFVTFFDEAAAASAVAKDNHTMFMNRSIVVQYRELSSYPKMILSSDMPVVLAPPPVHSKYKEAPRIEDARRRPWREGVPERHNTAFRSRRASLYTHFRSYSRDWSRGPDDYKTWPRSRYGTGASRDEDEEESRYCVLNYDK